MDQAEPFDIGPTWTPGIDVLHHNNDAAWRDVVYFEPPPAEIGSVLTASSTLKIGKMPASPTKRFAWGVGVFLAVMVLVELVVSPIISVGAGNSVRLIFGAIALLLGGGIALLMRFKHVCTYVGELGFARFTVKGRPDNVPRREVFLFEEASDLRSGEVRNFTNGIYAGTNYEMAWCDVNGQRLFSFSGSFHSKKGTPKPKDDFWFARAAETAWNWHIIEAMQVELDEYGFVQFNVNQKDWVRVGLGFMEFNIGSQNARAEVNDIKSLTIDDGTFTINTHDAGWFSNKGKFRFEYSRLANAQMFLIALEQMMGYQFDK